MKPCIILPLADNEEKRVPDFNVDFIKIKTSKIDHPFDHIFWSEIGKLIIAAKKMNWDLSCSGIREVNNNANRVKFGIKGFIQNRRFFKNLDQIKIYNENEVVLANEEFLGGLNIMDQFKHCHPNGFKFFKDLIQNKLKIHENLYENINAISPHNIFLCKIDFLFQYATFLEEILMPYFDENIDQKYGAWMAERLLHLYAHMYYKVKTEPITILKKI